MSHSERKEMVIGDDKLLSIRKQCKILRISRSSFYYQPKEASSETLSIMNRMDELFMAYPFYGSRQMMVSLQREGISIGRHRVRRLMRIMGLQLFIASHGPVTLTPNIKYILIFYGM